MEKTALVIGATGLVGKALVGLLVRDPHFSQVTAFLRTSTGIKDPKLREIRTDFDQLDTVKEYITGNVLFSCLGTTLKQAGGKKQQYKVDFTYQYEFARLASENEVQDYLLVSSSGADSGSMFFYNRMKGELEEAVSTLPFDRCIFIRPGVLRGDRPESRPAEKWGGKIIDTISSVIPPLRKYHSISGEEVARAMIRICKDPDAKDSYELGELHDLAQK